MAGNDPIDSETAPNKDVVNRVEDSKVRVAFDLRLAEGVVMRCRQRRQLSGKIQQKATALIQKAINQNVNPIIISVLVSEHPRAGHLYNRKFVQKSPAKPDDQYDQLYRELVKEVAGLFGREKDYPWIRRKVAGLRTAVSYHLEDIWQDVA